MFGSKIQKSIISTLNIRDNQRFNKWPSPNDLWRKLSIIWRLFKSFKILRAMIRTLKSTFSTVRLKTQTKILPTQMIESLKVSRKYLENLF